MMFTHMDMLLEEEFRVGWEGVLRASWLQGSKEGRCVSRQHTWALARGAEAEGEDHGHQDSPHCYSHAPHSPFPPSHLTSPLSVLALSSD